MIADLFLMAPLQLSRLAKTKKQDQSCVHLVSLKGNSSTVMLKMLVQNQLVSHAMQDSGVGNANPDAQLQQMNVMLWMQLS